MKIGDYVRTKKGIAKITNIDEIEGVAYTDNKNIVFGVDEQRIMEVSQFTEKYVDSYYVPNDIVYVLDYSESIIDLIEPGDYVNGMEVTGIGGTRWDKNDLHCYCDHNGNENWKKVMIPAKDIKSVVTKEQFESMEYKIGE